MDTNNQRVGPSRQMLETSRPPDFLPSPDFVPPSLLAREEPTRLSDRPAFRFLFDMHQHPIYSASQFEGDN